ncbi:hypothetical protein FIBSPDRAFT_847066, partial [Athelia psychrophila]
MSEYDLGYKLAADGGFCTSPCLKPPQSSVLPGDASTGVTILSATAQLYPLTRDWETTGCRIRSRGNAIFYHQIP